MQRLRNASAASLMPFVEESIEPGSVVRTDGWLGYEPLEKKGYRHHIVFLKGRREQASELLPLVHKAISLLKRWLLGTHQGAVSHEHLDYYLEFVFRFNARSTNGAAHVAGASCSTGWFSKRSLWSRRRIARSSPTGTPSRSEPQTQDVGVT